MTDREKVLTGLECLLTNEISCPDCPYDTAGYCVTAIAKDALDLLKEQEAVEPIPPTDESDLWRCGYCHHQIFKCTHQRYCEMCGRAVKWTKPTAGTNKIPLKW